MDHVGVVPSGSPARLVVTVVRFSAIERAAVAPPPLLVMTGASATLVTVRAMAWVSNSAPSLARTMTS